MRDKQGTIKMEKLLTLEGYARIEAVVDVHWLTMGTERKGNTTTR